MRNWTRAALFAASASMALASGGQVAAEQVGRTSAVRPEATQTAPGSTTQTMRVNDAIVRNASLDTTSAGALEVIFADNSKLSLGPNSNAVIDEFVYAGPGNSAGAQTLKYTKGVFRYVSGAIPPTKVKLQTPAVTIGIRGTDVRTSVEVSGASCIAAVEHDVDYTTISGKTGRVPEGNSICISESGEPGPLMAGTTLPCD